MGDKNFRLSPSVRPERYAFEIAPDLKAHTFEGRGRIELVLDQPVRSIVLHGVTLTVKQARIGEATASVSGEEISQTLTFAFDREIPAGKAALEVEWNGVFQEDLRGLYMAGDVAVTQFEAADARRVFPCFDEPAFKAAWDLSIVAPAGLAVIGNGAVTGTEELADGRRRHTLKTTPVMSSYLVAMVIGDLVPCEVESARDVPIRTWAVPEKKHLTAFGQECAGSVLPLLEDYFAHPYVFGKLDQIGIPDFEAGAMENSGCITYREIALLADPQKAPLTVKKRIAEVVAHEIAHMWFGNLVTMQWWDDLWLNEAFATWMAYKVVDQWKPEWRMWDDFDKGKSAALHLDALESTHPIRFEVLNADQATENFDLITYEKGGAMLRMLEGYLGAERFREGIRDYIQKHRFQNARADDLWDALGRAGGGQPIAEVANGWIGKGGYPLVEMKREGGRITLSQRRFFADPEQMKKGSDELWLVPVVLRWADDAGVHETRHLLREAKEELRLEPKGDVRWVCANSGGAGFYRVQYEPSELEALSRHGADLRPVERVGLVADAWALFRAGVSPLAPLADLVAAFAKDEDYAVLGEVVARLDVLERRCVQDAARQEFRSLVEGLLRPQLDRLGWDAAADETDARRLQRAAVIAGLALVARAADVVQEASRRFGRWMEGDAGALDPNLLDAAAIASARAADPAYFDRLSKRVPADTDPASKRRGLVALASVEAPALVERAVEYVTKELVPMQDVTTYLSALTSNRAAQERTWQFVQQNWSELRKKAAAPMLTRRTVEALGDLVQWRPEVEKFIDAQRESLAAVPAAIRQTLERMRLDEDVARRGGPELAAWLKARRKS